MAEKKSYLIYLRVIATFFVVLIHASTGFLYHIDTSAFDWNYANWINAATRCSVPIFVIISGALLLQKDEGTGEFYKKRLPKLIYPFIFWTLIYLVYYFYRYTKFELLSTDKIMSISLDKILHGANAHLWYLYMIIGLYLAIPFIRKILVQSTQREIEIFLLLWLASMCIMNKSLYVAMPKFDLTFFSGYIGYLVLGYYLSMRTFTFKLQPWTFALLYMLMVAIGAIGSFQINMDAKKLDPFFYNYLFITTALAAGALFMWIKTTTQAAHVPNWIMGIDKYSFGIYLSHIIPLNFLHPLLSKFMGTAWVIPLATISTIVVSIAITYLIRKLPYGKYVSG